MPKLAGVIAVYGGGGSPPSLSSLSRLHQTMVGYIAGPFVLDCLSPTADLTPNVTTFPIFPTQLCWPSAPCPKCPPAATYRAVPGGVSSTLVLAVPLVCTGPLSTALHRCLISADDRPSLHPPSVQFPRSQEQRSILPGIWGDQCLRCRPCLGEATPAAFLHLTPTRALHPSCLLLPSCSPFNVSDRHVFAVTAMSLPQMSSIWSAFLHLPDDIMWRMNQKRPFNFDVIVPDQM